MQNFNYAFMFNENLKKKKRISAKPVAILEPVKPRLFFPKTLIIQRDS